MFKYQIFLRLKFAEIRFKRCFPPGTEKTFQLIKVQPRIKLIRWSANRCKRAGAVIVGW